MILDTHYDDLLRIIMKSSYQQELEFLVSNSRRAKKHANRIAELQAILADSDAIAVALQRSKKL